ncbi:MAG: hypothetical protein U0Q22_05220 [Acidimicrobiales bacterium]
MLRRTLILLLTVVVLASTACELEVRRAGAACANPVLGGVVQSTLAQDSTHVLACVNGRWKRVMTKAAAVRLWADTTPATVQIVYGGEQQLVVGGESAPVVVRVLSYSGKPLVGYFINWFVAGDFLVDHASDWPEAFSYDLVVQPDGVMLYYFRANAVTGSYRIQGMAGKYGPGAYVNFTNVPAPPASPASP